MQLAACKVQRSVLKRLRFMTRSFTVQGLGLHIALFGFARCRLPCLGVRAVFYNVWKFGLPFAVSSV